MNKPNSTLWRNPLEVPVRFRIYIAPKRSVEYEIPPGGIESVPSEYDRAIQDVRGGVIVGGLAPLLQRVIDSDRNPPPAPILDEVLAPAPGIKHATQHSRRSESTDSKPSQGQPPRK